ncbi:hypothetical protein Plo01_14960 [Planobispora longispora]|uniref:Uncharacterized protein n=1 Tax=Planobispora longispora TaxID=28887 RepID=A0A8J3RG33_9ACTN|nr:hypothetical protein GCM10020093_079060 [Planobispora longispora]GIH75067.1 hypothetical protein Plo01_14960 [Planobispora longispora]
MIYRITHKICIVGMHHGGYRLIDVKSGDVRPVEVEEDAGHPVVFGRF